MTKDNQIFFHLHQLDNTEKLKDVMWVDARSRAAYQYFRDVVCFDSTYLTNKYELPFSNFVGLNHHGQTILLGCALVSHEDAETFVWLFRSWLSCMGGKPPAAMMTDQDAAMRKAIRIAMPMPKTRHRWCMWHIMQKFSRKLGSLTDFPQMKVALENVIYNSLTPEKFEEDWAEVVKTFKLEESKKSYKWLQGMQTTQRVESINSFFDGYLKKNTRLYQFAPRYCKAMESRANDEKAADRKFQKLYTDAKFLEVQIQCMRECYVTSISSKILSDQEVEHIVSDKVWIWHIIKVLDVENVETVPAGYIVDRWRKDIQRKNTLVKVAYHDPEKTDEVKRYNKIMNAVEPAALRGSISEQKLDLVIEGIMNIVLRLDESDVVTAVVGDNQGGGPSSVGKRKARIKKPTKRQVRKTKDVVADENPEPSINQNRGAVLVHQRNNYVHPQNPFTPGWGGHSRYVSQRERIVVIGKYVIIILAVVLKDFYFDEHQNYNNGLPVQHYQSSSSRAGGGVATNLFPTPGQTHIQMSIGGIRMTPEGADVIMSSQDPCGIVLNPNIPSMPIAQ
ncbi:protein FAR-RED IMPAIRED RESPONSE 1-like [Spinacia oleracea]|uniref:Protein FAR-RED IMPAIRED RESPONSE 1-like n=1 Tax=Spinacia oleracea TaxID=3562 RepID=A0ABM3RIB9_SPIOL|nr:protein FAR-RED IMPAIRED RESPONSE 1-like [Spinacia oleracea]